MHPQRWYSCYVFDLDGTIFLGDALLPDVADTIGALRDQGVAIRFLSNNCTKRPEQYVAKLERLGLGVAPHEVINPIITTIAWLHRNRPGANLLTLGSQELKSALTDAGFREETNPAEIDVVIASYDKAFNFASLQLAFDAIWFHRRAVLIQTNPDRYCPMPGGRGEPDAAAITAAIEASTATTCLASLGKPSPEMLATATAGLGAPIGDVIMIGDRLSTDIAMANAAGAASALVLTGDSQLADIAASPPEHQPDYVLNDLSELLPG